MRRLVVEDVVAQPAGGVGAPAADEVLDPSLLEGDRRRDVGVVGIVAGDVLPVGADAVAGVGVPLPVVAGLGAVLGDREAGELAAVGSQPGHPVDGRDGHRRLRARGTCAGDEGVAHLARSRARRRHALVVPVVAAVVGVQLPVRPGGVVPAVTVERHVQVAQLGARRVRDAVNVGIDRMPRRGGIDGHGDRLSRGQRGHDEAGREHGDERDADTAHTSSHGLVRGSRRHDSCRSGATQKRGGAGRPAGRCTYNPRPGIQELP